MFGGQSESGGFGWRRNGCTRQLARGDRSRPQSFQRFGERDALDQLNELEHITADVAAETIPALVVGVEDEAGCGIGMKGTMPDETATVRPQFDVAPNHLLDRVVRAH